VLVNRQVNAEMIVEFFIMKIKNNTKTALSMAQAQIPLEGKQKSVTEFRKFFTFSRQVMCTSYCYTRCDTAFSAVLEVSVAGSL
jgi:ligand-binding sensor protein